MNAPRSGPAWLDELLRSPDGGGPLMGVDGGLRSADGRFWPDRLGLRSLAWPIEPVGDDARMQRLYERIAPFYDFTERVLGRLLTGVDMAAGRAHIVSLLELGEGKVDGKTDGGADARGDGSDDANCGTPFRLLEVSPGPGVFQPLLRARIGPRAQAVAVDLSPAMLAQCRLRQVRQQFALVHANAQHLPFADASFDALFHFGGVNLFTEPRAALAEFVRVVRPGGIVAWGDEQMDASFRHPVGRRVLPRMNPGFLRQPPPAPNGLVRLRRHVVYGGLGYLCVGVRAGPRAGSGRTD